MIASFASLYIFYLSAANKRWCSSYFPDFFETVLKSNEDSSLFHTEIRMSFLNLASL